MTGEIHTDLMRKMSPEAMAAAVINATAKVEEGFKSLTEAAGIMSAAFGEYADIFPSGEKVDTYDFRFDRVEPFVKRCNAAMQRQGWSWLLNKSGIREVMSIAAADKAERDLNGELPPFNPDNIRAWLDQVKGSLPNMMVAAVKETWEFLRPGRSRHKTNTEYEIGEKVILTWMVEHSYQGCRLRYGGAEQKITALSNVFLMLDGKQPAKYPGDTLTGLREAMQNRKPEYKNDYFRFRWFGGTGTLHVWFLRRDLVKALNECAAGKVLKHNNAARSQRDQPAEATA